MSRKVLTSQENRDRIVREGIEAAATKFNESRAIVLQAMRGIAAEIEKNGGLYPYANGRITVAEVLRRAGKSEAYLRRSGSQQLQNLRHEVTAWVARINTEIANGATVVREKITESILEAQSQLSKVRQAYAECELLLSETLAQLEACRREIEELKSQNASIRKAQADGIVVPLHPTRR